MNTTNLDLKPNADIRSGATPRRSARRTTMLRAVCAVLSTAAMATQLLAATNDLTSALQKGLFEEEANRNLDAAIAAYQSLVTQLDKDRQVAATALFRLGECYRKLGKTNDAIAQYERILREFSDQQTLVTLSRQNLAGLSNGNSRTAPESQAGLATLSTAGRARQRNLLQEEISLVESKLEQQKKLAEVGNASPWDAVPIQQELLKLKRQLAAVEDEPQAAVPLDGLQSQYALLKAQLEQARKETNNLLLVRIFDDEGLRNALKLQSVAYNALLNLKEGTNREAIAIAERDFRTWEPFVEEARQRLFNYQQLRLNILQSALEQAGGMPPGSAAKTGERGAESVITDEEEKEIRRIQAMIQNSPDLINTGSRPPLWVAAGAGQLRVVRYLLDAGAAINLRGQSETPLHAAVKSGHKAVAELLLSRGADLNAVDTSNSGRRGRTPLHDAAGAGFQSIAELLLAHKANANARDDSGNTALQLAASSGYANLVKSLVPGTTNLNAENEKGVTALGYAAGSGNLEAVKILLDAKADPNAGKRDAPLFAAISHGRSPAIVELLIRSGADVNRVGVANPGDAELGSAGRSQTLTPLEMAMGNVELLKLLLQNKANPNVADYSGVPLVRKAAGNADILIPLLEAGADPNAPDPQGVTPLILAALVNGQAEGIRSLLAHGAKTEPRYSSKTALLHAAEANRKDAVEVLVKGGANINAMRGPSGQSDMGQTALQIAILNKSWELAEYLVAAGADLNSQDYSGLTALHLAVMQDRKSMVELLLTKGANPNVKDKSGRTPLSFTKPSSTPFSSMTVGLPPMPTPRTPRMPAPPVPAESSPDPPAELAKLLREHGALENLPDFSVIRVTRPGLQPTVFFRQGANAWNRIMLMETLLETYSRFNGQSGWRFPDLTRLIIHRFSPTPGTKEQEIRVNVLNTTNGDVDCAKDVPLEFGDVLEIPLREYALGEPDVGLTDEQKSGIAGCLQCKVRLVVRGQSKDLVIEPYLMRGGAPQLFSHRLRGALQKSEATSLLLSSSDLSRVKVTRKDPKTGRTVEWIANVTKEVPAEEDLRLRDGDVIEVPDK